MGAAILCKDKIIIGYKALHKTDKKGLYRSASTTDFLYKEGRRYSFNEEPIMCEKGFHFCRSVVDVFGYSYDYNNDTFVIAEVEATGIIKRQSTKYCTNDITINKILKKSEVDYMVDKSKCANIWKYCSGINNIGDHNSGSFNTGTFNSGYYNTGSNNIGGHNTGSFNVGNCNDGNFNTGSFNTGSNNTGNHNSGIENTGDYNEGRYNTGNYNKGHRNTGNYNKGNRNTGWFNTTSFSSGYFNTKEATLILFNKDSGLTHSELAEKFGVICFDEILENLEENRAIVEKLPNYDAQIFYECTGIDWR